MLKHNILEMMFEHQWGEPLRTPHKYKSAQNEYIFLKDLVTELLQRIMTNIIKVMVYVKDFEISRRWVYLIPGMVLYPGLLVC